MIIVHPIDLHEGELAVRFQAQIERDRGHAGLPRHQWDEIPRDRAAQVEPDAAPFVLPLLHLAMESGEPLEVNGPIIERFQSGLRACQRFFNSWFHRKLS
jgi:hypothetical protein